MTTDAETITVSGFFGDKEVTKDEFAKQWTDHAMQLKRISYSMDWQKAVSAMMEQVRIQAEDEFTALYIEQENGIK